MANQQHLPGQPMTLGNMRELRLIASCLNGCLSAHGADRRVELSSRNGGAILPPARECGKCGSRGNKIDVRPNWKEQPPSESLTGKQWR